MAKTNGKKRTSPSVERQLALALIAVIESAKGLDGNGDRELAVRQAAAAGQELLKANGYADLESIPTRVKRIENEIAVAVAAQDGAKLAQLGAALDRAKKGLPPLATEKKPRAAPRKPKSEKAQAEAAQE